MISKTYKLFGSEVEFFLDADPSISRMIMEEAYKLGLKLQKIFNIYDDKSEITRLNKSRKIKATEELLNLLKRALYFCEISNGEYDVSLGKKFLQRKKREELSDVNCSYKDIKIRDNTIELLNKDVYLDLGSIAKGHITDTIVDFFIEQGVKSGYINARGDIRVFGEPMKIGVKNPRAEGIIHNIIIKNQAVATSGDYMQYYGKYSKSHIINQKNIISTTIISDKLEDADVSATIIMTLKKKFRGNFIKKIGFPTMLIEKDLSTTYFNGYKKLIIDES